MKTIETDVVVIGGGATGAGILRDCALRGIKAVLVERDDIANGTTGRNHGLLHSGARYAVTDGHSAKECIRENRILKNIASHCVEETDGLFLTLPEDELSFQHKFITACSDAGIETQLLTPQEALKLEPNANPDMLGAVRVPDGTLDPFRLTSANILDAVEHGAQVMTYKKVVSLIIEQGIVRGVNCIDIKTGEAVTVRARQVVNAAGIWGQQIAEYANLSIRMFPAKGSLLIMDYRINSMVLNRCRKPADADILVPGDTISLIGTTSRKVPYEEIDNIKVDSDEIDVLIREGEKLAPILGRSRVLRAYCGVRPLISVDGDTSGRNISRGIVIRDHADTDGLPGLVTVAGGKLMTYRLMAEMTTDVVSKNLETNACCTTAETKLPGASKDKIKQAASVSVPVSISAQYRHGERAEQFLKGDSLSKSVVCECEMITRGEIEYAIEQLNAHSLVDLRRRTRLGMGPCQGEVCACRAADVLQETLKKQGKETNIAKDLNEFLQTRWKGVLPVLWGDALREADFTYWTYQSLLGASSLEDFSHNRSGQKDGIQNTAALVENSLATQLEREV
ncbi:anaerobic glycerol-3-phosphate dehydrogenase subunit A [Endozoicomonas sp. OPT23]|uniref:anaerobic glycerol-3-phosphate dehydrogenase subunit A n=1 Tax=Endozoicomonas sp. OPT23 TaxID=2072845 RepID=UPI00129A1D6E|nr:anaerobic glycerol-3-phosphate dehydrogenase subunit A [Endozoicomonas sp. OPT23]MRI32712.1 anaerobic glycerol-3-phosphate dehydrogenase subunit A [Endozoicomonas sp. OPT23]